MLDISNHFFHGSHYFYTHSLQPVYSLAQIFCADEPVHNRLHTNNTFMTETGPQSKVRDW